jgi:biopolymer transport protein ExbD
MNFTRLKHRRAPSVIIVSLIDVLLVVLIFLMVTTTFKKLEPALQLTLPKVTTSQPTEITPGKFQVLISTNFPFYYFEGQPISINQLEKQLKARVAVDPKLVVTVKADESVALREYLSVVDIVRKAEPGALEILTEKAP